MGNDTNNETMSRLLLSLVVETPTPPKHRNPKAERRINPNLKSSDYDLVYFFLSVTM